MAAWRHGGLNSLTVVEERPATGQAALVHRALPGRIRARRRPAARHEEARLRPHRQQQRRRGQRRRRRAGRVRGSASAPREGRHTGAHAQTQRVLRVPHAAAARAGRNSGLCMVDRSPSARPSRAMPVRHRSRLPSKAGRRHAPPPPRIRRWAPMVRLLETTTAPCQIHGWVWRTHRDTRPVVQNRDVSNIKLMPVPLTKRVHGTPAPASCLWLSSANVRA